jgi:hypothetical protein
MAVTATRVTTITYSSDIVGVETLSAASNSASPGVMELKTLASGFNTITVPTGGSTVVAVTIVPPAANIVTLTLKGITGDTGVPLHLTDPTTIGLAVGTTTFGLTTSNTLTGIRFYYT